MDSWSTFILALPIFFPCCFALYIHAFTRSEIICFSNCANAPMIVNMSCPVGVLVSICSWWDTKSIPNVLNVFSVLIRWAVERDILSNLQTRAISNCFSWASIISWSNQGRFSFHPLTWSTYSWKISRPCCSAYILKGINCVCTSCPLSIVLTLA